ncbi:hypothetical protein KC325_g310 [Hortaea werneckii]|nr:hypothetical protein KC325_g310 [Hortaea werneckii]
MLHLPFTVLADLHPPLNKTSRSSLQLDYIKGGLLGSHTLAFGGLPRRSASEEVFQARLLPEPGTLRRRHPSLGLRSKGRLPSTARVLREWLPEGPLIHADVHASPSSPSASVPFLAFLSKGSVLLPRLACCLSRSAASFAVVSGPT